ncbi:MAG: methylglyoxal synthase, partial [Bacteroidota bacterium]
QLVAIRKSSTAVYSSLKSQVSSLKSQRLTSHLNRIQKMRIEKQTIALVAHDARKELMTKWVATHVQRLSQYDIVCTGTTGKKVQEALEANLPQEVHENISIQRLKSGPLGGDQQLGAMIAEGRVDLFIFFWDTMTAQPHDVDVKALLRIATMYNIPTAMNQSTADFLLNSLHLEDGYERDHPDFESYQKRKV